MGKVISRDGTAIAYDRSGRGFPVILVDGALCSRVLGPMPKMAKLPATHFSVISYDRRGRNESGDTKPYAVAHEIEDIDTLIQEVGGFAFVLGVSSGAALGLAAASSGLSIVKLAMYEPPYIVDKNERLSPSRFESRLKALILSDQRAKAVRFFMRDMVGKPAFIVFIIQLMPAWSKLKAAAHTLLYDAAIWVTIHCR